jgi:hypothetical protein
MMANFVKCSNGHDFDLSIFQLCPFCGAPAAPQPSYQQMMYQQPQQPASPQMPAGYGMPLNAPEMAAAYGMPQAAPEMPAAKPTVGWLVCTKGPCCGKTYPLREERNFIGSAPSMDVVLAEDSAVSSEKHAVITFEPKKEVFIAQQGDSRALYYVNGEAVLENKSLKAEDTVEIGNSVFTFIPLCSSEFSWKKYPKGE